jgi:hypothetical protein
LAEENLAVLSSTAIVFETRWQDWPEWVQNQLSVFLVALDSKLEREAAVLAGSNDALKVLHSIQFNHGRVLAARN